MQFRDKPKYLGIFAHYDQDNIVDNYVIYYLKELKKIASKIIFVSDCDLPQRELDKLKGICDKVRAHKHYEYDFGSYKRGLQDAKQEIEHFDALILANDSCYGPCASLEPIFNKMENLTCDFWGLTASSERQQVHIQSYFMVFSKKVFLHKNFTRFFNSVEEKKCKDTIINTYELGLSKTLIESGFVMESYCEKIFDKNPVMVPDLMKELCQAHFPFLKVAYNKKTIPIDLCYKVLLQKIPKFIRFMFLKKGLYCAQASLLGWASLDFVSHELKLLIMRHVKRVFKLEFNERVFLYLFTPAFIRFTLVGPGFYRIYVFGIRVYKKEIAPNWFKLEEKKV